MKDQRGLLAGADQNVVAIPVIVEVVVVHVPAVTVPVEVEHVLVARVLRNVQGAVYVTTP